jgi:hypothetical protein
MQTPKETIPYREGDGVLKRYRFLLCVLFSVALMTPTLAQKTSATEPETNAKLDARYVSWKAFQATERFNGLMVMKTTKGAPMSVRVGLRLWSLDAGPGRQQLLVPEYTIFHLRAGRLQIVVNGKEEVHKSDDFWVLPAGSQMGVQVKGEAAVLETTTIATK